MKPRSRREVTRPRKICLEASTVCQLKCPSCPTASGETGRRLGVGFLKFADFKKIVDENPWVSAIELSNWGEIFLNRDLVEILEYAYRRDVALFAENGANLNHLPEPTADALVRYRLRGISCSMDGASRETYRMYRVRGDFLNIIHNIKTINRYKSRYNSRYPRLIWQFIAFGHNEHEIEVARSMAQDLDMEFALKLSWEDLYTEAFSPVRDREMIRREIGLDVASRSEFRDRFGKEYMLRDCCAYLWRSPQLNHDGRVLGCPVNYWADYGNAYREGLADVLSNEKMEHARGMLLGERPEREDIPCIQCKAYQRMKATGIWLTENEVRGRRSRKRWQIGFEKLMLRTPWTSRPYQVAEAILQRLIRRDFFAGGPTAIARRVASGLKRRLGHRWEPRLKSGIFSPGQTITFQNGGGWQPVDLFRGRSPTIRHFSCHVSRLETGHCPHPPHWHPEEEILLVLKGEVEILLPDLPAGDGTPGLSLTPGELVYYPAFFGHTLTTISQEPARYVMFKWRDRGLEGDRKLAYGRFDSGATIRDMGSEGGFQVRDIFEGATEYLERLGCHATILSPGAGYPAHADPYDVAIAILDGEVETLGQRTGPGSLVLYAAGEPHGMYNPGDRPAEYIVFEFQGQASFWDKLTDPSRWRRRVTRALRRGAPG
jgi:MoaA/NifB/PqqE/SkfB family radical SAM enzyme/quercetin dioxygenase-like cupin family protein